MKPSTILIVVLLSFITAFATVKFLPQNNASTLTAHETSYDRIIRTQTLRCGYEYSDAAIMKDDQGHMHGPWIDIMKAWGEATGLKIEWAEQIGWADVGVALKSGKIDAMCAAMWSSAEKAKEISFSIPLSFQAIEVFVRDDNHRFDGDPSKLNSPDVTLGVIDNDNSDIIAKQDFPQAKKDSLGALNGTDSELLMQVMTGKADATFTVAGNWKQFEKANPGKLRRLAPDNKLRVFGNTIAVDNADPRLLELINAGVHEIQNSGTLDKILDKADQEWPDMFIKPLKPYP